MDEYSIKDLAQMLSDEIDDTGKTRWSAKDVKEFFLSQGINLQLYEILDIWKACPNPVCACELLGCDQTIEATTEFDNCDNEVVIQFGDGNGAASRGTELDEDCEIRGHVCSEAVAFAAALVANELNFNAPNDFNNYDVADALLDFWDDYVDWRPEDYDDIREVILADVEAKGASYWKSELQAVDLGFGNACVYSIDFNGQSIYFDEWLMEEIQGEQGYDDEYDDEDEFL